jgi:hypothetical protein
VSAFAKRWRDWTTLVIGGYLVFTPWIFGTSGDEASSANAWVTGVCVVTLALWALLEAGPCAGELTRVGIGAWLLVSPFALGFAGSVIAWNTWIAGVLMVALSDIPNLSFDLQSWLRAKRLAHQARAISPESIVGYVDSGEAVDPEYLSKQIAECAYQICQTLREHPSELEANMCALGYWACVSDMFTLDHLIEKKLPSAGITRRLRLKVARRRAVRSLSRARAALPQELHHSSLHGKDWKRN